MERNYPKATITEKGERALRGGHHGNLQTIDPLTAAARDFPVGPASL